MAVGIQQGNARSIGCCVVRFDPASVAATTSAEQTITVPGVAVGDLIWVSKPTLSAGLIIGNARVSAPNVVSVTFANVTAGAIDAGSEDYIIGWMRPDSRVSTVVD
jgi:hypothetical protein